MKIGIIALNGPIASYTLLKDQLDTYLGAHTIVHVLGVDGGCKLLDCLGYTPNKILGDFDSIEDIERYKVKWPSADVMTFPPEKDYTDAELAFFEISKEQNLEKIVVIGAMGGRADHMLSILFLLGNAKRFVIVDEQNIIEKIDTPFKRRLIKKEMGDLKYLSIIPLEKGLQGITLSGFRYPLNQAKINFSQTVGISNELLEDIADIQIGTGSGYLIYSMDKNEKRG